LALPSGLIFPYGGSRAPDGYLFCQGQSLSTAQYANLFNAIGYSYGGSGASFNVPDLQGRVPVGLGTNADVNALTDNDGITTVANRTPNHTHVVPKHKHSVSVSGTTNNTNLAHAHATGNGGLFLSTGGGSSANVSTGGGGYVFQYTDTRLGDHSHPFSGSGTAGVTTDPSGDANLTSGAATIPYLVINYIIKV
jgi:microcystin-dependent protein